MKTASQFSKDTKTKLSVDRDSANILIPTHFGELGKMSKEDSFSPLEIKPSVVFSDFCEKGMDNPAYYNAVDARRASRADTKKQKFISKCLPGEQNGAKLTKIPGFNIWRLDFKKPASNPRSRTASPCYRIAVSLAMVAVMALVIVGISVIVHAVKGGLIFGLPWFPFEDEDRIEGVNRVAAHFRIMNRQFVSEMEDFKSLEYRQLVAELKHSLDVIFMDSTLVNFYNVTEDFEFSNGSVVVRCVVLLNRPLTDGAQRVGFAFVRALEEGKGILPPGMIYVDVHTVRFAAIKMETYMRSLEPFPETGHWSDWSSCMKNGTCDTSRIRVRRKSCGSSREDLCSTHTEIVETRPCLCPASTPTLTTASLYLPGEWSQWSEWSSCLVFNKLCDPQQIQRRTRNCLGSSSRVLPSTVCHRKTGEAAMQIRHCICSPEKIQNAREEIEDKIKESTLHLENDYNHWIIPV